MLYPEVSSWVWMLFFVCGFSANEVYLFRVQQPTFPAISAPCSGADVVVLKLTQVTALSAGLFYSVWSRLPAIRHSCTDIKVQEFGGRRTIAAVKCCGITGNLFLPLRATVLKDNLVIITSSCSQWSSVMACSQLGSWYLCSFYLYLGQNETPCKTMDLCFHTSGVLCHCHQLVQPLQCSQGFGFMGK